MANSPFISSVYINLKYHTTLQSASGILKSENVVSMSNKFPAEGVPGCIEGIPGHSGMFRGVPGVFRGCSGVFRVCSGVLRGVPGCSGLFRGVPGFTDTLTQMFLTVIPLTLKKSDYIWFNFSHAKARILCIVSTFNWKLKVQSKFKRGEVLSHLKAWVWNSHFLWSMCTMIWTSFHQSS